MQSTNPFSSQFISKQQQEAVSHEGTQLIMPLPQKYSSPSPNPTQTPGAPPPPRPSAKSQDKAESEGHRRAILEKRGRRTRALRSYCIDGVTSPRGCLGGARSLRADAQIFGGRWTRALGHRTLCSEVIRERLSRTEKGYLRHQARTAAEVGQPSSNLLMMEAMIWNYGYIRFMYTW